MAGYIGANTSSVTNNQNAAERRKKFTFTANTTVLSGLNFAPAKIHIFHNGIRLVKDTDYTEATDGKSVTLTNAAQAGDEVVAVTFAQDPASNPGYTDADVDAHLLTAGVTLDATNDRVGIGTTAPTSALSIEGSGFTDSTIRLKRTASGTNNDAGLQFTSAAGANSGYGMGGIWFKNSLDDNAYALIRARTDDSTGTSGRLDFITSDAAVGNATASRLTINSSGYVTTPYQPMFRVRCESNGSVDGTVSGGVTLAGTSFWRSNTLVQAGSHFSISTGRFTAPIDGYYYLNFSNRLDQVGSGYVYFTILDNGGGVVTRNLTNANLTYQTLHCSAVHYMSANDYVYVRYDAQADAYVNLDSDGFFSGFLIG